MERKRRVARGEVVREERHRRNVPELSQPRRDDNVRAAKKAVRLVSGQCVANAIRADGDRGPRHPFAGGTKLGTIWIAKLTQAMQAEETSDQLAAKEPVVVRSRRIAGKEQVNVLQGERVFPPHGGTVQTLATSKRAGDEAVSTRGVHIGEVILKLVANAREVGLDGRRLDVVGHIHHIEGEGVGSWSDGEVV